MFGIVRTLSKIKVESKSQHVVRVPITKEDCKNVVKDKS